MKTFSEITDTDLSLDLKIIVYPLIGNGYPNGQIRIGDEILFHGAVDRPISLSKQIDLSQDIVLEIKLDGKLYDPHKETALDVRSITIDGIEIKNHCYDLIEYENDHCMGDPTLYLGFNGIWILTIPGPFYRWWHKTTGKGWLLTGARSRSLDWFPN